MEEINRLHDIADDIGSTSWGYELASALHNIAADIGEKVDEMLRVLGADGVEVHKGDEVWSTTGEFDGKRTVSSVHIDPDEPPYAMFEERQKPYSCLCCYLTHRAPVIAADGEPLEVGQTVWVAENGNRFHVVRLCDDGLVQGTLNGDLMKYLKPEQLTHQRPVLDADGVPIKVGDTVWNVGDGTEYEVGGIRDTAYVDGGVCKIIECSNDELHIYYACFPPGRLTHTKPEPDSWSSVWADVSDGNETPEGMMRRCRALAERGE